MHLKHSFFHWKVIRFLFFGVLFIAPYFCPAQEHTQDSTGFSTYIWEKLPLKEAKDFVSISKDPSTYLKSALFAAANPLADDHQLVHSYTVAGTAYRYLGKLDSSIFYLEKAFQQAKILKDPFLLRNAAYQLNGVYMRLQDVPKLMETSLQVREAANVLQDSLSWTMSHLCNHFIYSTQGLTHAAALEAQKARQFFPRRDSKTFLQTIESNVCAMYIRGGEYQKALDIYDEIIPKIDTLSANPLFLVASGNKALSLLRMNRNREGLEFLTAVQDYVQRSNLDYLKAYHLILLAESSIYLDSLEAAEAKLIQADSLLASNTKAKLFGYNALIKGYLREKQGRFEEAIQLYKQSLSTATSSKSFGSFDESYMALSGIYARQGDHKMANYYLQRLIQVKDSIYNNWQGGVFDFISIRDSIYQNAILIKKLESKQKVDIQRRRFLIGLIVLILLVAGLALALLRNHFIRKREERIKRHHAQLKAYASELEDMAYATSHYLKEPVRGVGSYAGLIGKKLQTRLSPEEKEDLSFLKRASERLSMLMAELSDFFKLGSQIPAEKTEVDTEFLLQRLKKQALDKHQFPEDAIVLSGSFPVLLAQQALIEEAFLEIIHNAIKFRGDKPLRLEISCESTPQFHQFKFRDEGIGLEEKFHKKVFQIFYQVDPYTDKEGVGIGLSRVRKVMRIYEGQVEIKGKEGEYTLLTLQFPK